MYIVIVSAVFILFCSRSRPLSIPSTKFIVGREPATRGLDKSSTESIQSFGYHRNDYRYPTTPSVR
jgi:hypothetical protein